MSSTPKAKKAPAKKSAVKKSAVKKSAAKKSAAKKSAAKKNATKKNATKKSATETKHTPQPPVADIFLTALARPESARALTEVAIDYLFELPIGRYLDL